MRKLSLLALSCSLLAGRLLADPVVFTISNLTATFTGGGPRTTFSGSGSSDSGDSITISGFGGRASGGGSISPGDRIGSVSYGLIGDCSTLPPLSSQGGVAEIGGQFFSVQLCGSAQVFEAPNNLTFQPPTFTYVVPATAKGEATAVCSNTPNCANGTLIANVLIDLPGYDTIRFLGPPNINGYRFDSAMFNSIPIPEPSSVSLILLGSIAVIAVVRQTRRR